MQPMWSLVWCVGILIVAVAWGGWLFARKSARR